MTYEKSIPFNGNPSKAIEFALTTLTGVGFRIDSRSSSAVDLTGPGMNSSHGNPLSGASRLRLELAGSNVSARAELGAGDRLMRMVMWLLVFLETGAVISILVFVPGKLTPRKFGISLLPVLPWVVLLPLIWNLTRRRTIRGIDALLNNMAEMAK